MTNSYPTQVGSLRRESSSSQLNSEELVFVCELKPPMDILAKHMRLTCIPFTEISEATCKFPIVLEFLVFALAFHFKAKLVSCEVRGNLLRIALTDCTHTICSINNPQGFMEGLVKYINDETKIMQKRESMKIQQYCKDLDNERKYLKEGLARAERRNSREDITHYYAEHREFLAKKLIPLAHKMGVYLDNTPLSPALDAEELLLKIKHQIHSWKQ